VKPFLKKSQELKPTQYTALGREPGLS